MNSKILVGSLVLLAGLAGCGGDDGAPVVPAAGNSVPASATRSIEAFIQYLAALAVDDSAEPLDVESATPPVSETALPIELS